MIFDLSNEWEVQQFKEKCNAMIEKGYTITITRKLPKRSNSQNSYLHVLLGYFGSEYGLSIEEVKQDIYKRTCNPELFIRVKTNKRGQEVRTLRSSAELDSGEMTLSIERFRNYSSAVCGIYLPSPSEDQFLLHCEKVIEQNKLYL